MSNDDTPTPDDRSTGLRFPKWLKWGLIGALAVLVLGYGAIFLYAKVLNDSPDEFDQSDLDAALAAGEPASEPTDPPDTAAVTSPSTTESRSESEPTTEPATTPAAEEQPVEDQPVDAGTEWVTTDQSQLGYRVKEILFGVDTEGVGRTNQVEGSIAIDGTQVTDGEFIVDVASITSDDGRRDGQFRGRIMSTDDFPEAIFTLTAPIELGTEPVDGAAVTTSASGDLTLRGVTNPVTFDIQAELDGGRIAVLGNIPVVFADYGIDNPSTGGITTEDNGLLEFVLVFEPA